MVNLIELILTGFVGSLIVLNLNPLADDLIVNAINETPNILERLPLVALRSLFALHLDIIPIWLWIFSEIRRSY